MKMVITLYKVHNCQYADLYIVLNSKFGIKSIKNMENIDTRSKHDRNIHIPPETYT